MDTIEWLLDSDPSIRWQVLRDLAGASDETVAAERDRVATEGWGARLLDLQGPDGRWDGLVVSSPETPRLPRRAVLGAAAGVAATAACGPAVAPAPAARPPARG